MNPQKSLIDTKIIHLKQLKNIFIVGYKSNKTYTGTIY